ncbi:MAG TPA: NADH-ubiquinone oxidoreductase-F iron-sulfur binding region domain-containing protein [Nocardioidaceae bacterium]|nr:NADH-ubiquinone oxidoreductase-F iron-sulfur binding region domain-containing protein [Nocardioidaceae bacterium]
MTTTLATTPGLRVETGPALLQHVELGPSLAAHRTLHPARPAPRFSDLAAAVRSVGLSGRGGAAFPFARKLVAVSTAGGRRPVVVVNLSEGEPASSKDAALALTKPHLVLDGAVMVAGALRTRELHLVLPGEGPDVRRAVVAALAERGRDDRVRVRLHDADPVFVAGQARAVVELMSGRPNRPVTSWQSTSVSGYRGRPTLLSNAETYAQLALLMHEGPAAYRRHGTPDEPGTTLLTVHDTRGSRVAEVELGASWSEVLPDLEPQRAVLVGGYHGTWTPAAELLRLPVSRTAMDARGLSLGAGVVLVSDTCPLAHAATIAEYLAAESARRCGPCLNGLPALAVALRRVADGVGGTGEVERLSALVTGRGACAHPDGTARMVRSALTSFGDEVAVHARGGCRYRRADLGGDLS